MSIRVDVPLEVKCGTYDYMVSSMSTLCLWDIQLTFDWIRIQIHGAYHRKSEVKCCKSVQEYLRSYINFFAKVL